MQFAVPGAWNDLDLLEVGNKGLTEVEWVMGFAFWATTSHIHARVHFPNFTGTVL